MSKIKRIQLKGFYEREIKDWTVDERWLIAQRGKAIKIVEPLIQDAPLPRGKGSG